MDQHTTLGIALLCDNKGAIRHVLRNDLHIPEELLKEKSFPELVQFKYINKAQEFLSDLKKYKAVFDCEMVLNLNNTCFHFAGGVLGDQILIVGALTDKEVTVKFYEEMMQINNEQVNVLRSLFKARYRSEQDTNQENRDQQIYNDFIRINNEMVAMQRELEKKSAQQQVYERELRESHNFLQTMIDHLPLCIYARQPENGKYILWNQASEKIFELSRQQVLGKTPYELFSKELATTFEKNDRQVFINGHILDQIEEIKGKDERTKLLRTIHVPIYDEEGLPEYILSISEDITERKRMEAALIANQKMADLGTMAAGISHELNSPLQVITGITGSLIRHLRQNHDINPEKIINDLEKIDRNSWRSAEIVRSLLLYSTASSGDFEKQNLNELIQDTLLLMKNQFQSWNNITINTDLKPDLPLFECDRNQIIQIIINLLDNARDAMPSGGNIFLNTKHDNDKKQVILIIQDDGKGIPGEIQDKIFNPFYTTKPIGKGAGLGLSIVLGLVKAHGGEITVNSSPDNGATFTLSFPVNHTEWEKSRTGNLLGRYDDSI